MNSASRFHFCKLLHLDCALAAAQHAVEDAMKTELKSLTRIVNNDHHGYRLERLPPKKKSRFKQGRDQNLWWC